jgi:hypothetical protein
MDWLKNILGIRAVETAGPPPDSPPELATTLLEAEGMANELDDYLNSDPLYRRIWMETPLGTHRLQMTLGVLFEHMEELAGAEELGPNDRQRLSAIQEAWDAARDRYPEQFQEKLRQEHDSYLRNWKYFLGNMAHDPDRWREDYEVELRNRRRVELMRRIMGPDAPPDLADLDELEEDLEEQATRD